MKACGDMPCNKAKREKKSSSKSKSGSAAKKVKKVDNKKEGKASSSKSKKSSSKSDAKRKSTKGKESKGKVSKSKEESKKKGEKEKKIEDDVVKPTRALGSYIYFSNDNLQKIKARDNCDHKEAMRKAGAEWNAMSEEEKSPYEKLHQ